MAPWSIADVVNKGVMELLCVVHGMPLPNVNSGGPNTLACNIQGRLCRLCGTSVARHCPVVVSMAHAELTDMSHKANVAAFHSMETGLHPLQIGLLPFSCATSVLECLCGTASVQGPHMAYALAWGWYESDRPALVPSELVHTTDDDMWISEVMLLCERTLRNFAVIGYMLCNWNMAPCA